VSDKKAPQPIHKFWVKSVPGLSEFEVNLRAERECDEWCRERGVILTALIRGREEHAGGDVLVQYRVYGTFMQ
jgi:hypothetical protein